MEFHCAWNSWICYGWNQFSEWKNILHPALYCSRILFLLYIPVALWFRAKETLKTNKVLAGTLHYEITEKNIHVSQGKETGDMEWEAVYKIVANAKQILIYSNRKSAYIIPMEQIGDQYVAFREIAEQKLEKYKLRMKA